jgi:hypothetical protein
MVQVDVFWSYGLGSGFAVAASRQLLKAKREGKGSLLESPYFTRTLLFLSLVFVPSGSALLWAFPSWETMHAGTRELPAWLVTAFVVTNVSQGILGFLVSYWLLLKRRLYASYLQMYVAYFFMFFILVHGWDGTGYRRFFSATPEAFAAWSPSNVAAWFASPVAITLYLFAPLLVPLLLYWMSSWLKQGFALSSDVSSQRAARTSRGALALYTLGVVFVGGLGSAIVASLLIHALGWLLGGAAALIAIFVLFLNKRGVLGFFYDRLLLWES